MTVNELIEKLVHISSEGWGDDPVVFPDYWPVADISPYTEEDEDGIKFKYVQLLFDIKSN